ncbi:MAG: hypothetical protein IH935_08615 [Acidobacteria bacterium]|nr:hypothetical protein [Acidobacteriota bacterium]
MRVLGVNWYYPLADPSASLGTGVRGSDGKPDGQQFLMIQASEQQQEAASQINVVLNWF